ncbi:hypothetical protein KZ810_02665 [Sphingomonas sp. RHCKR47]|uniref:hypothetical protein n=1 Tax=Sphingomonas citricola TaxID=2862498 RepID=UPI001CA4C5C9|nr:hypothetical protein [Sphingomonas citricola]MBW6522390.1 hypothetical protein [Sphingomonas citricola]
MLRNAFADLATDETLQDVLAKLPAAPATAGGQATGNASLAQIVTLLTTEGGYLDGVETLLAAVRDKLIASPATDAKVEAVRALLAGTLVVSAAALPLPFGAATSGKQDTGNTTLASILAALGTTLAVSAASLPLPNGAATSAAQTTMSTTLANILTALGATLKVQTPIPAGVVTGQVPLTANTTAQLPSVPLVNGIVIKAAATNTAPVLIGPSGVTTTTDGTGTGYPLQPGEACSFALANANGVYARSTAAGVIFYEGN